MLFRIGTVTCCINDPQIISENEQEVAAGFPNCNPEAAEILVFNLRQLTKTNYDMAIEEVFNIEHLLRPKDIEAEKNDTWTGNGPLQNQTTKSPTEVSKELLLIAENPAVSILPGITPQATQVLSTLGPGRFAAFLQDRLPRVFPTEKIHGWYLSLGPTVGNLCRWNIEEPRITIKDKVRRLKPSSTEHLDLRFWALKGHPLVYNGSIMEAMSQRTSLLINLAQNSSNDRLQQTSEN
ncbi:hypothetical protein DFH28DRAFT_926868 [Melampsora americana]|nr:hypothetical protein DFH28DRAFT_926868 [Melampsora americana]